MAQPLRQVRECPDCSKTHTGRSHRCSTCQSRKWRADNPGRAAELQRSYAARQTSETRFAWHLKHRYNITADQYFEMLDRQNGVCAVCGNPPEAGRRLSVDHDHGCCPEKGKSCGECVRGLLCQNCNAMLGMAGDSSSVFRAAIEYLEGM